MCMHHPQSSLHYTDVLAPTIMMVTSGENSISLEWSPPEGSPLSYTVTWTGRGVTSSVILPPTARNYTIRGLDSNTAYSSTVEVYSLANNATVSWSAHTLPQGELVCISASCIIICLCCSASMHQICISRMIILNNHPTINSSMPNNFHAIKYV